MPKIIIREIDNTTAGKVDYANFSVALPGYAKYPVYLVDSTEAKSYPCLIQKADGSFDYKLSVSADAVQVFDTNGVYECSNQDDFVKYVGKKKGDKQSAGEYAEITLLYGDDGQIRPITIEEFYSTYKNQVYTWTFISKEKPATYKKIIHNDLGYFKLSDNPVEKFVASAASTYVVCKNENLGHDAQDFGYNGNQIAYELLGLGYTVLYKLVDEKLKYIVNEEEFAGIRATETEEFWSCLKDKSTYDFRYICTGDYAVKAAYAQICAVADHNKKESVDNAIATGRGDCLALVDLNEKGFKQATIIKNIKDGVADLNSIEKLNQYAAICCPRVNYYGDATQVDVYENLTFPASFHYLACAAYAKNELNFAEWYAIAGYTRGVSNYIVSSTSFKLGEIAINALQPRYEANDLKRAVNLVINNHGSYYFWGNRTAYTLKSDGLVASHFLNIRQLCSTIKKGVYTACRQLTFDPNSDLLWGKFCNLVKPTLEKMKADQGIQDYRLIKVKSKAKALLTAKVRIVPIEAVEDFDISLYLEDSVAGITVAAEE